MRRIKQFFLLVCLLAAGTQGAWASSGYGLEKEDVAVGNLTFDLYKWIDDGVSDDNNTFAVLKGISGTAEEVVIPDTIRDGSLKVPVKNIDGTISNSYVKKITFKTLISFSGSYTKYNSSNYIGWFFVGKLNCPSLETLEFLNGFNIYTNSSSVPLQCDNLTTIIIGGGQEPSLSGSWSEYSTSDPSNITAYVEVWSQETCNDMHTNASVWSQFLAVLPYEANSDSPTVNLTITIDCRNYPPGAPVDLNALCLDYNGEKIYGGQSRTFEVERGSIVDIIPRSPQGTNPYAIPWITKMYLNGVPREHHGPFRATDNLQEDLVILEVCEPDCYFVPVANLSAADTPHSLYWNDDLNVVHAIAPQSLFLVPVRKNSSSGKLIYAMEDDHDNYTLRGYWYNGIDYMSNSDQSQGGVLYQDELWQGDEHRLEFTLQPTADLQERQVLIGLADGVPTSDKLTIHATQGEGGAMALLYTLDGVEQSNWYRNPISGGNLLASVDKSKLGNSFTLRVVPEIGRELLGIYLNDSYRSASNATSTEGDTLTYNLGNVKAGYDVYRISVVYKDVVDFSKRKIHVRSSGTPAGFAVLRLWNQTTKKAIIGHQPNNLPTDFSVEVAMGTEYKIQFLGQEESAFSLMRAYVNGVLVTNTNASYTIGNFDEEILFEFFEQPYVCSFASNATIESSRINADGTEEALGGGDNWSCRWVEKGNGLKIKFVPDTPGSQLTKLVYNSATVDIATDSHLTQNADGSYTFTLTAAELLANNDDATIIRVFAEFESASSGGTFDVNGDGEINVTDVTALVSKILHP